MESIQLVTKLLILVFVVSSMAALGQSLKFKEIVKPLQNPLLILVILVVNFVASPALAYLLIWLFPVNASYETGLLLLSTAAGAPFLPKLVALARGDVTLSVSVMILQLVGSIALMPFILHLLIPNLTSDALSIALPLVLQVFLPLVLGMVFRHLAPVLAGCLFPIVRSVSNISALGAIVLLLATNIDPMFSMLGSGAGLLAFSFVLLAMLVGYAGGTVAKSSGIVHALAGGQRNIAAALVIAASNRMGEHVLVMLVVATFVGLIPLVGAALYSRKNATPAPSS
ncbi:MAG TPA: hypothetical protein PLN21_10005 [Gemmatales bacterium]|nr:hypothetical protein [Gemmatales bacterium]